MRTGTDSFPLYGQSWNEGFKRHLLAMRGFIEGEHNDPIKIVSSPQRGSNAPTR